MRKINLHVTYEVIYWYLFCLLFYWRKKEFLVPNSSVLRKWKFIKRSFLFASKPDNLGKFIWITLLLLYFVINKFDCLTSFIPIVKLLSKRIYIGWRGWQKIIFFVLKLGMIILSYWHLVFLDKINKEIKVLNLEYLGFFLLGVK